MSKRYLVTLESDVFGAEPFHYDTIEEMLTGITGLIVNCDKEFKKDGVERRIVVHVGNSEGRDLEPA